MFFEVFIALGRSIVYDVFCMRIGWNPEKCFKKKTRSPR